VVDITDAIDILGFLFLGNPEMLKCEKSADSDRNGTIDISDALAILAFLFTTTEPLPAPLSTCDYDVPPGDLTCEDFPGCRP
jgi:hypothetical protein